MRQLNQNVSPNNAMAPAGFEAVVRDQRRVGIANVLSETEARAMKLPRMGLDIKKIVNEVVKRVQPVPSDSVPQMQSQNVVCDHQSSANVVDEMEDKSRSLPNVISGFEKQVTDEAVLSVQDVRPMNEPEELRRPNDEAGTKSIWKVYTRKKRPNAEAGTERIWKVYTRKKWRGGPRPNQHGNNEEKF